MGLFDSWNEKKKRKEKLAKGWDELAQVAKDLERAKGEKAELMSDLEKLLIKKYGSYDKIPDLEKKFLAK